jgi:hypothetical protein
VITHSFEFKFLCVRVYVRLCPLEGIQLLSCAERIVRYVSDVAVSSTFLLREAKLDDDIDSSTLVVCAVQNLVQTALRPTLMSMLHTMIKERRAHSTVQY